MNYKEDLLQKQHYRPTKRYLFSLFNKNYHFSGKNSHGRQLKKLLAAGFSAPLHIKINANDLVSGVLCVGNWCVRLYVYNYAAVPG